MTYRAGISERVANELNLEPCEPHVKCDACGAVASGITKRGDYSAWMRNGKHPPGWFRRQIASGEIVDFCKACTVKIAAMQRGT